ncbi:hypothetical protein JNB71_03395 [Rhizobium herbae]|uniref:Uncharacterized protein n=1 Tax=Rhizobium herbae TaxID=508661 RepID=A0ABS7H6H9_9HYPH|nr:hypothetical protein [Rhizobium herbae]MBW9062356.1 hypothetical protein [Rhizobium herbae]
MQLPLAPPPLDENGNVKIHDHDEILGSHGVLRRISPYHLVDDEKAPQGRRVSSAAFQASSGENGGMSVDLENSIIESGHNPQVYVLQPPFIGAVRFTAAFLRGVGFSVGYDPLPANPHHGEVWGAFTGSQKKQLVANAVIYVEPR